MARNTSVSLDDHLTNFIAFQVESGRYGSAGDVIRAGLRLLEDQEAKSQALLDALIEGEQSGLPASFDFDVFIARKRSASVEQ